MATSFEFLYLNKRRKTIQEVLIEHGIKTVKDFELFLTEQSLIASQQSTMKEVKALCTEIIAPKSIVLEEELEPEDKPITKRKSKRSSNNQPSDDEDIQSPLHTDQSPPTLPETN